MNFKYSPSQVCTRQMKFSIEDGCIKNLHVVGGCDGNLQGIARLIEGMPIEQVIDRLSGVHCGGRTTSCPDQLARALKEAAKKA